jgi:hypothetical protein
MAAVRGFSVRGIERAGDNSNLAVAKTLVYTPKDHALRHMPLERAKAWLRLLPIRLERNGTGLHQEGLGHA